VLIQHLFILFEQFVHILWIDQLGVAFILFLWWLAC